jgi:primary-amine oxidase
MLFTSRSVSSTHLHQLDSNTHFLFPDNDEQIHPAGRHVPQTSGEPSQGIPAWIAADPEGSLDNTDVVLWHTFGVVHFPSPEDYPVMPAEPMTVLLRPRNFFTQNPALDVPPSYSSTPSQVANGKTGIKAIVDNLSTLAFGRKDECCEK